MFNRRRAPATSLRGAPQSPVLKQPTSRSAEPVGVQASSFSWRHAGRKAYALNSVDLEIEPGERVLIRGDSGSGKSTLLAAIAGVLGGESEGDQAGRLELYTRTGRREEPGRSIPVGLVLQDPDSQVVAARVGDDVAVGCENLGVPRPEIWARVRSALALVDLEVPLDHPTKRLSGGQKQRLALAGVLAIQAGIILLDEPTANLDPKGAQDVRAAVQLAVERTGATLVVVEHQWRRWAGLCTKLIELGDAGVRGVGKLEPPPEQPAPGAYAARPVTAGAPAALWTQDLITRCGPPRNVRLPEAASTVITGANGAGKSTLLLTMAGLLPSRSGQIGLSPSVARGLAADPAGWRSTDLAQRIGYVFQNPEAQFVARSVAEELRVGPKVMGGEIPERRIAQLVERLRLGHLLDANPYTLSGGEKRRLSVATCLVTAPSLVLLDEPTFGQDPSTFAELVRMLRELVDSGTTVAAITHTPEFIAALGDWRVHVDAPSKKKVGESA